MGVVMSNSAHNPIILREELYLAQFPTGKRTNRTLSQINNELDLIDRGRSYQTEYMKRLLKLDREELLSLYGVSV